MPRKTATEARPSNDAAAAVEAILKIVDDFCREHLNSEYATLCYALVEKLARVSPSPLAAGKANVWACAVIRVIGWVNFLDDPSQQPHMKLTAIDKALGVGHGTAQTRSKLIRDLFGIQQLDRNWTLPGLMDQNPMTWLIKVDGFVVDARMMPRETQEIAFRMGLIPYIPADRETAPPVAAEQRVAVPPITPVRKAPPPDPSQRTLFE